MIGSAIIRFAIDQKIEILCIARKNSTCLTNLPKSDLLKIVFADLAEYKELNLSGEYNAFFHLAWDKTYGPSRDDIKTQLNNIQYTLDAVYLAHRLGCKAFGGAGSQAEYGIASKPLRSDTPVNPQSGYGIAKYTAGKLSGLLCSQLGIRHNWIRILSVFGPLDAAHTLIMYAINELAAGHSPEFTKCEQIWDYLYCDDAARAFLAVGNNGINGKVYPLGSGSPRKLSEYLESLKQIVNPNATMQFGKKDYYPHQPMDLTADISELIRDTGWQPGISFEEGIRAIIEKDHKRI
jgi:nucleoside-diphosphate-sugar epimerase